MQQDDVNWKLSLLMDDELPSDEAIALLERLQRDPELQTKWYQYHLIRQAMHQPHGVRADAAFIARLQVSLAEEPAPSAAAIDSPVPPPSRPFWSNPWLTVPVALAAGVMVAVLWWRGGDRTAPAAVPETARVAPVPALPTRPQGHDSRLEAYLFAHSEGGVYLSGAQHMLSYARIVSRDGR